jgi:hypothetical protein
MPNQFIARNGIISKGDVIVTGSVTATSLTASSAVITGNVTVLGTASINTLIVNQTEYSSGSNQLGDAVNDFQTFYGTVTIPTGSFTVTGSTNISGSLTTTSDSTFNTVSTVMSSVRSTDSSFSFFKTF